MLLRKEPPTTKEGTMLPGPLGVSEATFKDGASARSESPTTKRVAQCSPDHFWSPLIPQSSYQFHKLPEYSLNTLLFCFHQPELIFYICMQEPLLGLGLFKKPN